MRKIKVSLLLRVFPVLLFSFSALAASPGVVHRPPPKDPVYLSTGLEKSFQQGLPPAPTRDSAQQKVDEKELFRLQKSRTAADCREAEEEVQVSLQNLYGEPRGPLPEAQVKALSPFFEQVRNEGSFFVWKLKKELFRERPFAYLKGLDPCVPRELSGAYPSGHATQAKLFALILADFFPAEKDKLEARARAIGRHRVLSGVHHPSDVEAGYQLAAMIYAELGKSPKFRAALAAAKAIGTGP